MKKLLLFLVILSLGCGLGGCGWRPTASTNGKINIVTTIFPQYDFVRNIAGDQANITLLLRPGAETHSYEPSPQDIIKIKNSTVFVYTGGESDEWVERILASLDTDSLQIVSLLDCVPTVEEELVEGMQEEEAEAEEDAESEPEYDEHVWTAPRNAKLIVQKITDTLCAVDTPNAVAYRQNAENYLARLDKLDADLRALTSGAKRKTLVFGDRFPFRYFTDAYGLKYFAAFPGCSTETEASPATIRFLIDKMRQEKIPVVLHIELSNQKMAKAIAEATGAQVRQLHAVHNITRRDFQSGLGYLDLMRQNIEVLKEALY
ncbi:zinc transport system substrate-binding protein [Candidatus Termititenax persephonae]|uniref:Zinc transport system substrate-binding protein n=1 Tax=Candidatus Termititenax persephonae TaxID=2218525 RepID=A0A388TIJ5_9BACT|nr:zinc transport system substrate-binding protein [Candidatus Termititenax persephonae]